MRQDQQLLHELSAEFGISTKDLVRIIMSGPQRYKVYEIPKRNGGIRVIAQPARDLKILQRYLLDTKLSLLPVHPAATGYVHGRNIAHNARLHVHGRFVLKLDFENFFPSIKVIDWENVVRKSPLKLAPLDLTLFNYIMFWGNHSPQPQRLSIGAPTSPALSNIVMFRLDEKFGRAGSKSNVTYSRYADDITVSGETSESVLHFEAMARSLVATARSPTLRFNEEKRGLYGMGQRRMVTGLIITPDNRVSIGRDRKRLISAMLHKIALRLPIKMSSEKQRDYLDFVSRRSQSSLEQCARNMGLI